MKTIKAKTYYFADMFWSSFFDSIEDEFNEMVALPFKAAGIKFENVTCTDTPPFKESYEILFFDWGGMSLGNSLLNSFCRQILQEAKDNPSIDYIMTSTFTSSAMKDAQLDFGEYLPNIYLTIEEYIKKINNS